MITPAVRPERRMNAALAPPIMLAWMVAPASSPMMRMRQIVILTVFRLGENLDIPNGSLPPGVWPVSGLRPLISAPASSVGLVLGLLWVILLQGSCFCGFRDVTAVRAAVPVVLRVHNCLGYSI